MADMKATLDGMLPGAADLADRIHLSPRRDVVLRECIRELALTSSTLSNRIIHQYVDDPLSEISHEDVENEEMYFQDAADRHAEDDVREVESIVCFNTARILSSIKLALFGDSLEDDQILIYELLSIDLGPSRANSVGNIIGSVCEKSSSVD